MTHNDLLPNSTEYADAKDKHGSELCIYILEKMQMRLEKTHSPVCIKAREQIVTKLARRKELLNDWDKATPIGKLRAIKRQADQLRKGDNSSGVAKAERHKQMQSPNALTTQQWQAILEQYDHRCAYCGKSERDVGTLQKDHIIPFSRGGAYSIFNIVPACGHCNSKKGAQTPNEVGMTIKLPSFSQMEIW